MGMGKTLTASAKLLVKLHGQGSQSIELTRDSFTIGRKADNDLPIDDHTVSSRHARIVRVQSVYFLEDFGSTNGTVVNGRTVDRAQLHDADVITIGQHRMIFQDNTAPPAAAAPADVPRPAVPDGLRDPLDFPWARRRDGEEDDLAHPIRMCLGIVEREGRSP